MFRSLGIQVVTYHNEVDQLLRLAEAISATVAGARELGVERVDVLVGDCGDPPSLAEVSASLRDRLDDAVDRVDCVEFGANLGSGGGSNALAERHDAEAIWVLNPDTYPAPSAARELLLALAVDGVGAVDARQTPVVHPKDHDPVTGDTSWVSGASMLVRRTAFDDVGGFDSDFFPMYCDDVDLSWRLRAHGWRTVHAPAAVVFHDKRIGGDGALEVSAFERRSGALARLWIARRYQRPDIEADTLAWIDAHGDPPHHEAAAEFRARTAAGDEPRVVDGAAEVAQFIDGEYAHHRFGYSL